jgi:hypothetical protein
MTTEIYILLILGLSFLLTVIKTAIRESLRNSKPTNINYGTINQHYYGFENPQSEKKIILEKNALATQINGEIQNQIQLPPK